MDNLSKLCNMISGKDTPKGVDTSNTSNIERNVVSSELSSEEQSKWVEVSKIIGHTIEIGQFTTDTKQRNIAQIFADEVARAFQVGKYKPYALDILGPMGTSKSNDETGVENKQPSKKSIIDKPFLETAGKSLLLLVAGIAGLGLAIKSWSDITPVEILTVIGTFATIIAGIIVLGKNKVASVVGIAAFGAIILELLGLGVVIDKLGEGIKKWSDARWEDIGKVGTVLGSIGGVIAVITGIANRVPKATKSMLIGGALTGALIGLTYLLSEVLPPLSESIISLKDVQYGDIGKVDAIFGGLATIIGIIGAPGINVAVGIGEALFAGLLAITYGIAELIPIVVDSLKYIKNYEVSDLNHLFVITETYMGGVSKLFGDTWWSKIKNIFSAYTDTTGAFLPLVLLGTLAVEMSAFSRVIGTLIESGKNITKSGIDNTLEVISHYITKIGDMFGGNIFSKAFNIFDKLVSGAGAITIITPILAATAGLITLTNTIKQFVKTGETINRSAMVQSVDTIRIFVEDINSLVGINNPNLPAQIVQTGKAFGVLQEKIGFLAGYSTNIKIVSEGIQNIIKSTESLKLVDESLKGIFQPGGAFGVLQEKTRFIADYFTNIGIVSEGIQTLLKSTESLKFLDESLKGIFQSITNLDTTKLQTIAIRADIKQIHTTNSILLTQVDIQNKILQETINNGKKLEEFRGLTPTSPTVINTNQSMEKITTISTQTPRQLFNNSPYSFRDK